MEEQVTNEQVRLYSKLNAIRLELSNDMNKSGANTYAKFTYFQLKDFMPKAIELCNNNGIFTKFQMERRKVELPKTSTKNYVTNKETGETVLESVKENENFQYDLVGVLYVTDLDTGYTEVLTKDAKEASVSGATPIQNVGATSTYMKRYMYMDLFEINENDAVDGDEKRGEPDVIKAPTKKVTKPKVQSVEVKAEPASPLELNMDSNNTPIEEEKVNTAELMKVETKMYIANYAKQKGLDPRTVIVNVAKQLNTDVPLLKENQKDAIIEMIDKM